MKNKDPANKKSKIATNKKDKLLVPKVLTDEELEDKDQAAMKAVAKHPFEKGLLDYVSEEMSNWVYFLDNGEECNKLMAAIVIKATDEYRESIGINRPNLVYPKVG